MNICYNINTQKAYLIHWWFRETKASCYRT